MTKFIAVAFALLLGSAHAQSLQGRDFNGDGSADGYYDTAQNITWLADANYHATLGLSPSTNYAGQLLAPGQLTFVQALTWVSSLTVHGLSDWRLPNRFIPDGGADPIWCDATECYSGRHWSSELSVLSDTLGGSAGSFLNLQAGQYMTNELRYYMELQNVLTNHTQMTDETGIAWGYVMAVHQGDVGSSIAAPVTPVPEPSTYALMLVGLIALTAQRWRRPSGRLASG
jgi:hypothetical protein